MEYRWPSSTTNNFPSGLNGHLQFNPAGGELMVQHNRGGLLDANFNGVRSTGPEGATLYVIDIDGQNERSLSVGKPHTAPVTGHESWIGKTGRVLLTTQGGKIYVATPGGKQAEQIAQGAGFIHISASPDGRFFVVDSIGTGRLHLGCIATGRVRPFCDTSASGGSPQYTHTHPYMTPGNHRVIFNSDRTGIPQVYAARIPEGLLARLEEA
jgi:Tol biopolymer transport system component